MNKLLFLSIFLVSTAMAQEPSPTPATTAATTATMQKLYSTLSAILTDSSCDERFCSKDSHDRVGEELKTLSSLAHTMKDKTFSGDKTDPTLSVLSGYLNDEVNAAYSAFKAGKTEYARTLIHGLPSTCIACHSRNDNGTQFTALPMEPTDAGIKPIEKAEFYAATRQYDRAEKAFLDIIKSEDSANNDPYTWEHAIQQGLTIAIRVKKDPNLAKKIVDSALDQKKAAIYVRDDLTQWKKSIQEWLKEPKRSAVSEKALYKEGGRLISEAHRLQKYPMDHSGDVLYLRASSTYYDLIQNAPTSDHVSEALLMQGICNEVLNPRGFEDLHRLYYEACIKKTPHSLIAMDCYRRYERSTVQGYTGSAGTAVPEEVKQKLLDLFSQSVAKGTPAQVY